MILPAMPTTAPPSSARPSIPRIVRNRYWWLALLAAWTAVAGLALHINIDDIHRQSLEVATEGARNMFRMVVLTRNWNASHGGIYVPVTPRTQPNPYLEHPRRDIVADDGTLLTLINPAYMTRLVAEMAAADSGAVFRLTSLRPIRPQNAPDPWERSALESFERGAAESIAVVAGERGSQLRYMAPLLVKEPCLQCHAKQGYRIGDVRGGISVSQAYAPIEAATGAGIRQSAIAYGTVYAAVALLGWLLLELLRRRWLELAANIRELEETRSDLVQSEKMASLGRMVAGFAHEINTPVGIAVGAVSQGDDALARIDELLAHEEVDEAELRSELANLKQGSTLALANLRRAAGLVQSFKRTSIDQGSEQSRSFHLREVIDDVLQALHGTLKRLPIEIRVDCPDDVHVDGYPGLVGQLLTNLAMNAVQHAFDDGRRSGIVRIAAACAGDELHLVFEDNGAGMRAEDCERIFEPFFTTRRGRGGSGLGLYICHNIVTAELGGSLQCHSAPDAGCRFDIRFPIRRLPTPERTQP